MTWYDQQHLLAMINFTSCMGIVWFCICRLNTERARVHLGDRLKYTLLLATAISSALQPMLWGEWSSWSDAFMSFAVCLWLGLSSQRVHTPDYDGPQRRLEDA